MIKDNKNLYWKILKIAGITFAILAILAVAIVYLVYYLNQNISAIGQKQKLLAIAKAERLSSVVLQNDFKKIEQFMPIIENVLPDENGLYNVLSQLESLGDRTGIKASIQITSPQPAIDENGNNYVSFNASASGSYESLRKYFNELNSFSIFIKISNVNISGSPSISGNSNIIFSGRIYIK